MELTLNSMIPRIQFTDHLKVINDNFTEINKRHQEMSMAAEMLNSAFDKLFTEHLSPGNDDENTWVDSVPELVFGAYYSWAYSYLLSSSCLSDIGYMVLRRSIDFACYLSKIVGNNKRALLWMDKSLDGNQAREFGKHFSVPRAYFSDKYNHLHHLLVFHDFASEYAVHGNMASLLKKAKDNSSYTFSFQDDPKGVSISAGLTVFIGKLIIDALIQDLHGHLADENNMKQYLSFVNDQVQKARIESANIEYRGRIPRDIIDSIVNDDRDGINALFKEIKSKYVN